MNTILIPFIGISTENSVQLQLHFKKISIVAL